MDALEEALLHSGSDAYVAVGSSQDADMRYLTRFTTTDSILYIRRPGERGTVIVSQMECERAERESTAAVMSRAQAGLLEILKEENDRWRALARLIAGLVKGKVLVPPQFPYALARELSSIRTLEVERTALRDMRAIKSPWEIGKIQQVQVATDEAMDRGITMIRKARVKKGLLSQGAVPLTSGMIRAAMHKVLLKHGCMGTDTIVACGEETTIPHLRGEGQLRADEPIVIDIFPRDEQTGYYSDMSRTVCRGEPSPDIAEMYRAVRDAQDLAARLMRPGVSGAVVYQAVVDFFGERGYESGASGFVHNLGHGVGLEVHEAPSLGPMGEVLHPGNVVTNEPGLYHHGAGGVRLENTGVIGPGGFISLTRYPNDLVL
ncbi:MAG: Xaa-Pro peptidase family protein [Methanolinea sp.]|jgi:Xaa-Pro aminopeptidase|nr:Xaa-Pro peptidase family protein [Methanolinea sp.]